MQFPTPSETSSVGAYFFDLRTELLEAECLPDTDDAWALLKMWIRTWRRGTDIEAAQDFYIFRFAPDRQSVI